MRFVRALLASASIASFGAIAHAQSASNEAAAEALFNEGKRLVSEGKIAEGCEKLSASHKLDPAAGTLIHLGDCYEKLGRPASAWAQFREAVTRARAQGRQDWADIASARATELERQMPRITIVAPEGVEVLRGDEVIPRGALGTPLPTDPGEHVVSGRAPGKKTFKISVVVRPGPTSATVTIPQLEDEGLSLAPATPPGRDVEPSDGGGQRTLGWVLGGVGVVGIGVGAVEGLVAIGKNKSSTKVCPESGVCADAQARADNDDARSAARVSTIAFVAGGVLAAAGVVLILTAPKAPPKVQVGLSPAGASIGGSW
jgi:hypothetical protein